jgi:DDE superfamily endonuclease
VIDDVTPQGQEIYLIADNYATHKHPNVQKWLARHPRFHMHFTPTSSSWLNMVERFFRDPTVQRLRRGIFRDVEELVMAIGPAPKPPDKTNVICGFLCASSPRMTPGLRQPHRSVSRCILMAFLAAGFYFRFGPCQPHQTNSFDTISLAAIIMGFPKDQKGAADAHHRSNP